jgi:alkylation response protein AidB-like acyl-CoA dehydrogenase
MYNALSIGAEPFSATWSGQNRMTGRQDHLDPAEAISALVASKDSQAEADLSAADEARMVREAAGGVAIRGEFSRIRGLRHSFPGFDRKTWRTMCALGWPALRLAEEDGGCGFSMLAYCALAEELGAALTPEPLILAVMSAAVIGGARLQQHIGGELLVLPMWQDNRNGAALGADLENRNGKLYGRRSHALMAGGAQYFLAIGRHRTWLIDAADPGLRVVIVPTQDGAHMANIELEGAAGELVEGEVQPAFAEATLASSAYLLGIVEAALQLTLDYLRVRVQFGKPIGSFQALQHRAVDLKLQAMLTRASVEDAAQLWDRAPRTTAAYAAVSRAKARASAASLLVTRHAIQLHGGIGFTDEHDIGLFLRKAMVVAPQFGDAAAHRARFAALTQWAT